MDYFEIKGDDGYVKVTLGQVFGFPNETSYFGGYETQAEVEIKSQNYFVKGRLGTTTGEIYNFFKKLEECQSQLEGTAEYKSYEGNLELKLTYDDLGHIEITGEYCEMSYLLTKLRFEMKTDQSYLTSTLIELKSIANKYGDDMGVKK